jgi:o-succinylbenzoate synthase
VTSEAGVETLATNLEAAGVRAMRWRAFRLPMRHRFEAAHGALEDRAGVALEIVNSEGTRGLGEASPLPSIGGGEVSDVLALLERTADVLLHGADPMVVLGGGPGTGALRCALDVALLDLEGRRRGLSIARLLEDDAAEAVTVNAVIGGGPPSDVAGYGRDASRAGYRVVKLKVGVGSIEEDVARVRALREACPDAMIRLDANGAWDEERAGEAIRGFYPLRVELLEQPVAAAEVEALARIRSNAPLRVGADEALSDGERAQRVLALKAADLLVLKPMVLGGVRPALALARQAALLGIGAFVTTTFDSSIGTAAAAHLAAALPTDAAHGLATVEHLAADVVAQPLTPSEGWLRVPSGPGLGLTLDERALDAAATGDWSERSA